MAQHDYDIANGTGAAVRSDINNALAAIVSQNSGTSEPATMYAYQIWADTTTGELKLRNAANNAWITLRRLDGAFTDITLNAQGDLRFADADSSNYVAFQAPATVASNVTWTLPAADGTSAQVLSTNGSGTLSWSSVSSDKIEQGNTKAEVIDTGSDGRFVVTTEGTERLRITSAGNVGIGTNPQEVLDVNGRGRFQGSASSASSGAGLELAYVSGSTTGQLLTFNRSTSAYLGTNIIGNPLMFSIGGSEAARIDTSSRLLVGTSTALNSDSIIEGYKASGNTYLWVQSNSLGNDQFARGIFVSGGRSGQIGAYKHSGITNPAGFIYTQEEDGGDAWLWTDNSGNFRISGTVGHIGTTSGTVVGTQTSDERIKNILGPVTYGLDEIKQLDPVSYALKSDPEQTPHLGFTAQQVNQIIPESVFDTDEVIEEGEPTKLGMEYVALIPVLVNAIKELSAEIDSLKAQLQAS
jgi:hypothetical protein